jgi:murein DD-endopeptidase MepM/ murein hydrolase activator NlpD
MFAGAVAAAAFNDDHGRPMGVTVRWNGGPPASQPTASAQITSTPSTSEVAGVTPEPTETGSLTGFAYPVAGGCLPASDALMPGAPREYRNGIHEGVDFYDIDNCAFITLDTEVLAVKAGRVIRADWDFIDITPEEVAELEAEALEDGNNSRIEDRFRGRQVWIDHGGGIVTRYAHLNGIADGMEVGKHVNQGELIAYVGDSGTPESVTAPGTELHLHFELRAGDSYLGEGEDPARVRELYTQAFEQ